MKDRNPEGEDEDEGSFGQALKDRDAARKAREEKKKLAAQKKAEEEARKAASAGSDLQKMLADRKNRREELKKKESENGKDGEYGSNKRNGRDGAEGGADGDSEDLDLDESGDGRSAKAMDDDDKAAEAAAREKEEKEESGAGLLPFLICLADRLSRLEEVPKVPVWLIGEINKKVKAETLTVLRENVKTGKAKVITGNQKNLPVGKEIPMPKDLTGDINQLESLVEVPVESTTGKYFLLVEGRVSARRMKPSDQEFVECALDHLGRIVSKAA